MAGRKPLKTKVVEAAAVLLNTTRHKQLNIVPLNKALFYLDLVCLRDLGRLATEGKYVALDFGPAVSDYHRAIISRLTGLGIAEQVKIDEYAKPLRLVAMPEIELIDECVVAKAMDMASFVEPRSASALSAYSHQNMGWKIAYDSGQAKGLPARLINMRIAMQQICTSYDPWMDEPLSLELADAVDREVLIDWA